MLLTKHAIGLDNFFNDLEKLATTLENTNYPPYNLYKAQDNVYVLELALAGYKKEQISIELANSQLVIAGEHSSEKPTNQYIHKGISSKKFKRAFMLDKHMEVTSAEFSDGILAITLTKYTPDYLKPKTITIS